MHIKEINNVCIINCFDTYEHRVDLLYSYFKQGGANVQVLTSNYKHIEKCSRNDVKKDFEFIDVIPYKRNLSFGRLRSHASFSKKVFEKIDNEKYELLWILVPPNSLVRHAANYKKKHRETKIIFDLIDLWPETMPISKFKSLYPFQCWKKLRNGYLDCADEIVTECNLFKEELVKNSSSIKIHTIYLARKIKRTDIKTELRDDRIALCYLGSINNIIDIDAICKVIMKLKKYKQVELHIIGDGEKRIELIKKSKHCGAIVVYHGKIYSGSEKQEIFNHCHFGLNLMKKTVFVGLTMKSLDYFEGNLPIINNIKGDTWNLVDDYHIGVNISDKFEIEGIVNYDAVMRNNVMKLYKSTFGVDKFNEEVSKVVEELKYSDT